MLISVYKWEDRISDFLTSLDLNHVLEFVVILDFLNLHSDNLDKRVINVTLDVQVIKPFWSQK